MKYSIYLYQHYKKYKIYVYNKFAHMTSQIAHDALRKLKNIISSKILPNVNEVGLFTELYRKLAYIV